MAAALREVKAAPGPVRVDPARNRGGTWIEIGPNEYLVPPLGLRSVQELQDRISSLAGLSKGDVPTGEQMQTVIDIVHSALKRNYDFSSEDVADMLDLGNFARVINAVLGVAGFQSGGAAPGEAIASTGDPSTQP